MNAPPVRPPPRKRDALHPRRVAKTLLIAAFLLVVRPLRDWIRTARRRHPVRVFTFHRVTTLVRDGMTVSPEVFARQMAYVRRYHDVVDIDRAVELAVTGARLPRPVAAITFDDGYHSVHEQALPVMQAQGMIGCAYVCTDLIGTDRRLDHDAGSPVLEHLGVMDWEQLRSLQASGWSIGGHTANHVRLSAVPDDQAEAELRGPLTALRDHLQIVGPTMAYPFGKRDDMTPELARRALALGYRAVFSNLGGENDGPADPATLRRIDLGGSHDTIAWKAYAHGLDLRRIAGRLHAPV